MGCMGSRFTVDFFHRKDAVNTAKCPKRSIPVSPCRMRDADDVMFVAVLHRNGTGFHRATGRLAVNYDRTFFRTDHARTLASSRIAA
jgi:hypothetical protein